MSVAVKRKWNPSHAKPTNIRPERNRIKADLMATNATCSHCGCILTSVASSDNIACLVIDRLSCFKHSNIVRAQAKRDAIQHRSQKCRALPQTLPVEGNFTVGEFARHLKRDAASLERFAVGGLINAADFWSELAANRRPTQ